MRTDEVGIGSPEIELPLKVPAVLGEGQGLPAQPTVLLPQGQVLPLHVSGVDLPLATVGTPQALRTGEDVLLKTEHDAAIHRNDSASLAAFVHLGIPQEGMGHSHWVPGPAWLARRHGALPDAERLQQDVGIVSEGV
jgi:hypothetical protein